MKCDRKAVSQNYIVEDNEGCNLNTLLHGKVIYTPAPQKSTLITSDHSLQGGSERLKDLSMAKSSNIPAEIMQDDPMLLLSLSLVSMGL